MKSTLFYGAGRIEHVTCCTDFNVLSVSEGNKLILNATLNSVQSKPFYLLSFSWTMLNILYRCVCWKWASVITEKWGDHTLNIWTITLFLFFRLHVTHLVWMRQIRDTFVIPKFDKFIVNGETKPHVKQDKVEELNKLKHNMTKQKSSLT